MVARQHGAFRFEQGEIGGRLDGLGGLVDHRQIESPLAQSGRADPCQRGQHDGRPLEHVGFGAILSLPGLGEQRARLALLGPRLGEAARAAFRALLARRLSELQRILDQPRRQLRLLVLPDARLQRVLEHGGQHPRRMADAHRIEAGCGEPLDQVVHGEVGRRASQDGLAASGGPADDLHQHGRLAGPRRPMDQRDVQGAVGQLQRLLLLRVEAVLEARTGRLTEAKRLSAQRPVPASSVRDPPHGASEALVRDRTREELQGDPAVRDPVRRRLIEGDGDPPARPARDDPRRSVLGDLATLHDAHQRSGPDLGASRLATGRGGEADQGASGEAFLVDRLQVDAGHAAGGALAERQPGRRLREALPFRVPLRVEERAKPVEVRGQVHRRVLTQRRQPRFSQANALAGAALS